jgi:hypothetical protein
MKGKAAQEVITLPSLRSIANRALPGQYPVYTQDISRNSLTTRGTSPRNGINWCSCLRLLRVSIPIPRFMEFSFNFHSRSISTNLRSPQLFPNSKMSMVSKLSTLESSLKEVENQILFLALQRESWSFLKNPKSISGVNELWFSEEAI